MVVRDELCEGVRMGGYYTVIGVPMYNLAEGTQQSFINTTVEVGHKEIMIFTLVLVYVSCGWYFSWVLNFVKSQDKPSELILVVLIFIT